MEVSNSNLGPIFSGPEAEGSRGFMEATGVTTGASCEWSMLFCTTQKKHATAGGFNMRAPQSAVVGCGGLMWPFPMYLAYIQRAPKYKLETSTYMYTYIYIYSVIHTYINTLV